jgi:2-phosphosulfolactate phosphatase
MDPNLKGKTIAMTTTNGTQAIGLSKDARNIIIGSFLNLNTVVKYLKETSNDTVLICSGWKGNPCIEDTLYAGAVVFNLSDSFAISQDSAIIASELYKNNKDKKMALVENASHVKRLARLNIIKDIEFCLQESIYNVLPIYINGKLKNLIQ